MGLKSMTGFSRTAGEMSPYRWTWEVKTVNAKGLDLRLRLPPGYESLEPEVRSLFAKRLARGAVYANLTIQRDAQTPEVRVDAAVAAAIVEALSRVESAKLGPLTLDGLLTVRGVVELVEPGDQDREKRDAALLSGLGQAIESLVRTRAEEGRALCDVLRRKLAALSQLIAAADAAPGRKPEAVRERLVRLVEDLSGRSSLFDPTRLHQEALLLAAKADVAEEIDRLRAHVAAASALVETKGPAGRRLDFLSQEMGREANTLNAKSNDVALTTIAIEMRVEIEQFREQVQNIE
jgi:uncharacterized protein (TIGR00255 family)